MSDDPKKPILSDEDIFLKTNAGVSPDEESAQDDSIDFQFEETPPQESIENFESLDAIPQESSIQLDPPPENFGENFDSPIQMGEQQAPVFDSANLEELAAHIPESEASDSPEFESPEHETPQPTFVSDFSASAPAEAPAGELTAAPVIADSRTIDSIKNYSESLNAEAPASAQLPFTLRIEGKLSPQEAEKLLDILSREKMDIREVDIEPQLEAGRLLIPRISEYAGILLIQALRGIRAKIYFQPSDIEPDDSLGTGAPHDFNQNFSGAEAVPTADSLPVTQGDDLPQLGVFSVIDTLIASGMLSTRSVEAMSSNEYTALTEALIRELKFKATRRGARGITHLSIQLTPLTLPTDYRVTVSGTAVS